MKTLNTTESLIQLQAILDSSLKAYYTRFGDGDILLTGKVRQRRAVGNNQTVQTPELTKELRECLQINDALFLKAVTGSYEIEPGMEAGLFVPFPYKEALGNILAEYTDLETFYNPILFHYLGVFKPEILKAFITKYIRKQPKMFIGNCSQKNMEKFFGKIDVYVETPPTNSYGTINQWWPQVEQNYKDVKVVISCTGSTSRVLAKRLWHLNAEIHYFDFGSIVDPIDNRFTTRTCWKMKGREVRDFFIKDKKKNDTVVYTAIFGGYDQLNDPIVHDKNIDYVCFTDNTKIVSDIWQVIMVNLPIVNDPVKSARFYKACPHKFLDKYDYSLWVDGNMVLKTIPDIKQLLDDKTIALMKHPSRDCVYAEAARCKKRRGSKKIYGDVFEEQLESYRNDKYPENAGLYATGIIAREHKNKELIIASELWWDHISKFSHRDQVSFPVAFRNYPIHNIPSNMCNNIQAGTQHSMQLIKSSKPYIDVRIPYEPGPHLGMAYNRSIETVEDWVLILDHDVFIRCNPQWYEICQQAIRQVGHKAGLITCLTNRIASHAQRHTPKNDTDDIKDHFRYAKQLWEKYRLTLEEVKPSDPPFSGFFMLTHKKAWKDVGGVIDGFYGVDNDYSYKIDDAGYKRYIIKGLYVYHAYRAKDKGMIISDPKYKVDLGGRNQLKVKLTSEWRGHKPGEYINVTPGQKSMILTLNKGITTY